MANKRIQKKKKKQAQIKKLVSTGYTEKQARKLQNISLDTDYYNALKGEKNREYKKNTVNNKINYAAKKGITISKSEAGKYTYKQIDKIFSDIQKEKNRLYKLNTQKNKIKYAKSKGMPNIRLNKMRNLTYKEIDSFIDMYLGDRTVYKAKESLQILWSDVTGDSQMSMALHDYDEKSTTQMIDEINNRMSAIKKNGSGGSGSFKGVANIQYSNDENYLKNQRDKKFWRGYNKGVAGENGMIMKSDEWTLRGYANMMLSVLTRTSDDLAQDYYNTFETYAYNNLPEIHRKIFN